ncbi:MAG: Ig-like domain-containing protein [Paracoccaceae bacterium]|nr:Ig-like domain-containing protein [Paracoccaceae bacterium]
MVVARTDSESVNVFVEGDQTRVQLQSLDGGGYVAVWMSTGENGFGFSLYSQEYNDFGERIGTPAVLRSTTVANSDSTSVTGLQSGDFAVSWLEGSAVYSGVFAADGTPLVEPVVVASGISTGYSTSTQILPDGSFLVTYSGFNAATSTWDVSAQRLNADGTLNGSSYELSPAGATQEYLPATTVLNNGDVATAYYDADARVSVVTSNADGSSISAPVQIARVNSVSFEALDIVALAGGGYVVVWTESNSDGSGVGIVAQLFDAAGNTDGAPIDINEATIGSQNQPDVIATPDGGFFVVWSSVYNVAGQAPYDIVGRGFGADGIAKSGDIVLNEGEADFSEFPSVTLLSNGAYVVAWNVGGVAGDGSGEGVKQRIFSEDGVILNIPESPVVEGLALEQTVSEDDVNGAGVLLDTNGAAAVSGPADFDGGRLLVMRNDPDDPVGVNDNQVFSRDQDQVTVNNQGTGAGQIGVSGTAVTFGGTQIGTITGDGIAGANLEIQLNANATPQAVEALVENLLYRNGSDDPEESLELSIFLESGDGASSAPVTITINVEPVVDAPEPIGVDRQVNSFFNSTQDEVDIAALNDGGWVAVWTSVGQDSIQGSNDGIIQQRFNADGVPIGPEVVVNTQTVGVQNDPAVAALTGGGWAVSWYDQNDSPNGFVKAQIYGSDGAPVGGEINVPTTLFSTQFQPDISSDGAGGFYVTWYAQSQTTGSTDIRVQRFDDTGAKQGNEITVNAETDGTQTQPTVAALSGGGFVLSWSDFNSNLGPSTNITARVFDNSGNPVSGDIAVNTNRPNEETDSQITALTGGGFVVTWTAASAQDGSSNGIFGQIFDSSGAPQGGEFQVNEFTSSDQSQSTITALDTGGFAVAWQSFQNNSTYNVFVQFFGASGERIDSQILVNSNVAGSQTAPTISTLANGDLVVGWVDTGGQDGSGSGVFQRIVGNPANYATVESAPQLAIAELQREFAESDVNGGTQKLMPAVAVGDTDSADFDGGTFVVLRLVDNNVENQFSSPDDGTQDQLGIASEGGISTSGTAVSFNGTQIGVITSDGAAGDLAVDLNQNATPAAVEALAQAVTYSNLSDDPAALRDFRVVLSDGDGGVSIQQIVQVTVIPEADGAVPVADEVQNNTFTNSTQQFSDIAVLNDGGWVVVWESTGQQSSGTSVYAQRYSADGSAVGEEFLVDSNPINSQSESAVTGLSDGGFAITWYDSNQSGVRVQLYNTDGSTRGGETVVETQISSTQSQPAIASYDGGFAIVWADFGSVSGDIKLQRFDNSGSTVGSETQINDITVSRQDTPQLAAESDGSLRVVWTDQGGSDGNFYGVYARDVAADNTLGGAQEDLVNTFTASFQYEPTIAILNDGRSVAIWRDDAGLDGSGSSIQGQAFDASGAPIGGQFLVNEFGFSTQSAPDIVALADGGFAVVYQSAGSLDGSGTGIFVQEYKADLSRRDGEQQVNVEFSGTQYAPSIAATATGYVVTWSSQTSLTAGDGSGIGVFSRVFGDNTTPVPANALPELSDLEASVSVASDNAATPTTIPAQIIDDSIQITDADSGFANGSLEVMHDGDGTSASDQLSILDGKGITTSGSNVLFDGVVFGTVPGSEDGVNGADLRINFNANATQDAVQALAEQIGYSSTSYASSSLREVTFQVTDAGGATSAGQTISIRHLSSVFPAAIVLTDNTNVTFDESALKSAPQIFDGAFDFDYSESDGFDGGLVSVTAISFRADFGRFETLSVVDQGSGAGQISVSGNQVSFEGTVIGTIDGTLNGEAGAALQVNLGTGATEDAVDALLEALALQYASNEPREANVYRFRVEDATGRPATADVTVTVVLEDDGSLQPLGDEEQVNSFVEGGQEQPDVAALTDGGYVAVWQSNNQDGTFEFDIYAQRYDADGSPVGGEFRVNVADQGFGTNSNPTVSGLENGGFAVAWQNNNGEIYARTYDSSGASSGEFIANDQTSSTQSLPDIQGLSNGNILISWQSVTSAGAGDGSSNGVIGRLFTADGTPVSDTPGSDDIILNTTTTGSQVNVSISALGAGGFVAVWEDDANGDLKFQRFDQNGATLGSETVVRTLITTSYGDPVVTELAGGGFVVVFTDFDGSGEGIFQQLYTAAGVADGGPELVNPVVQSTQNAPDVTAAADGGWLVTWQSNQAEDGSGLSVLAQSFAADGSRIGESFIVNEKTTSSQFNPAVTTLADGRVAAVWVSITSGGNAGDGSGNGVFTRLFGSDTDTAASADPIVGGLTEITLSEDDVDGAPVSLTGPGTVVVSDADSADFDGGRLLIGVVDETDVRTQFTGVDGAAQDNLTVASASVALNGNDVEVDGTVVGTLLSDGQSGAPFEILFNNNATVEVIEEIFDAMRYSNSSDDPEASRTYQVVLTDGDGGSSEQSKFVVNITPTSDTDGPIDSEAQVNSATAGTQDEPEAAGLTGGGHVVVWESTNQDNPGDNNTGVFGQLYDANGQPNGVEFQINTTFEGAQNRPDVVGLSNGGFAVIWDGAGAQGTGIYAQLFDATAQPVGNEFRVNDSDQSEVSPRIAASDTGFAVVWAGSSDVLIKTYDNDGNAVTTATNVTGGQSNSESETEIVALADGRYVVSYTYSSTNQPDTSSNGVFAQIINADGSVAVSEFLVNTDTLNSESDSSSGALSDGGFVIAWTAGSAQDSSSQGVYAQIFNADGSKRGEEFLVNELVANTQADASVTGLADGGFAISFTSNDFVLDGSGNGVLVQQYDAGGNRLDGARLVNEETSGNQSQSTIAALSNGGFVVGWTSVTSGSAGDGNSNGVFQRIFGDAGDYNVAGRPVIEGVNDTRTFVEDDINGAPQLIDANAAVALSDMDSTDFDGGFVRVDVVVAERGYTDQFSPPDDLTQDQLSLSQTGGVTLSGNAVSVDGVLVGAIVSTGVGGQPLQIDLNANATVEAVERLIENLAYRNASDDPSENRTLQIQVADGDGGVSDAVRVELVIEPSVDGVLREFPERQANTTTLSDQSDSSIAATDEGFVIIWRSFDNEPNVASTYGIFGQRFDTTGNPIGDEFLINTTEAGSQLDPQVTGLTGGGFVVAWGDPGTPDGQDIFIQRYDGNGDPVGGETQINTFVSSTQQDVEIIELANGDLLAVWDSFGVSTGTGIGWDVVGQIIDGGTGALVGSEFLINQTTATTQQDVSVEATAGGGFVATWRTDDGSIDGASSAVLARIFDDSASGYAPADDEFLVNTTTSGAQQDSAVAVLNDGNFVIVWEEPSADGSTTGIFGQIYASDGALVGGEFRVNDNRLFAQSDPGITALDNGGFAVVYSDNSGLDGSGTGVFLQQFNAQGNRIDGAVQVNTENSSTQSQAEIANIGGGRIAVTFTSNTSATAGDGSSNGVFYQLFNQVEPPISDLAVSLDEDTTYTFSIADFDNALEGPLALIRLDVVPSSGELLLDGLRVSGGETVTAQQLIDGDLVYDPAPDFNGFDSFFWSGSTDGVTFTLIQTEGSVSVAPINDAVDLQAQPDLVLPESAGFNLSIPLTIGDPDNSDTYTVTVDYGEGDAPQVFNTTSKSPFIQNRYEDEGTYAVSVTVDDNNGSSETINFDVTIENVAPNAGSNFYGTDEDTALSGPNILSNDSDPGLDLFTITAINGVAYTPGDTVVLPSGATVSVAVNGALSYDPTTSTSLQNQSDGDFTDDTFSYTITDDGGLSDTADVTVRVTGSDDFAAQDDVLTVDEDSSITGSLLDDNGNGADTDPEGDTITITEINNQPALVGAPVVLSGGGVLTVQSDGSFIFDASGQYEELGVGETRLVTFTYDAIEAGEGDTANAQVEITVTGVNDDPTANNDLVNIDFETESGIISPLLNDFDIDGDTLTLTDVSDPANGSVDIVGNTFTFTPDEGFSGDEIVTYTLSDGNGGTTTADVTLRVAPPDNRDPNAVNDTFTINEDTQTTFDVVLNDTDPDGDTVTISSVTQPLNGSVFVSGNQVVFTPDQDFNGATSFTYTVIDGNGGTDSAEVTVTVDAVNDDPIAVPDTIVTTEDDVETGNILTNDTDVDLDTLSVSQINGIDLGLVDSDPGTAGIQFDLAGGGVVTIDANGDYSLDTNGAYDALAVGDSAAESFTYEVSDGAGGTDTETVSITISGVNDDPDAVNDTLNVAVDTDLNGNVLDNNGNGPDSDVDAGDILAVTELQGNPFSNGDAATLASGAVVSLNSDGTFTYEQNGAFAGLGAGETATDSFTYGISDGNGGTDTATVTITIGGSNQAPTAVDDGFSTDEDSSFTTGSVLSNDTDPNGDTLNVIGLDDTGTIGNVTDNGDGTFDYDTNGQFESLAVGQSTTDSFEYTINDGNGGTDTATVTVTVNGVNDAPDAQDDGFSTDEDSATSGNVFDDNGNGADADIDTGDSFTVSAVEGSGADVGQEITLASGALVTLNANGTFDYDPNGQFETLAVGQSTTDSFSYTIDDGNGGTDTATVTINIDGVNDAPVAQDDGFSTDEDTATSGNVLSDNGAGADSDIDDGDTVTVSAVEGSDADVGQEITLASGALLTLNADGTFDYDPNGQFEALAVGQSTTDSFTYTIDDGNGGMDTATVTINIDGVNDPVLAVDDSFSMREDDVLTATVAANDIDPDGPSAVYSLVDTSGLGAASGALEFNDDGTFAFDPFGFFPEFDDGEFFDLSFEYQVNDGAGGIDTATVEIEVEGVTDPEIIPTIVTVDAPEVVEGDSGTTQLVFTFTRSNADPGYFPPESFFTAETADGTATLADGDYVFNQNTVTFLAGEFTATFAVTINGDLDIEPDEFLQLQLSQGPAEQYVFPGAVTGTILTDDFPVVNEAPDAVDDDVETDEDTSVSFNILDNDSDPNGDPILLNEVFDSAGALIPFNVETDLPEGGTVLIDVDGSVVFNPNGDYEAVGFNPQPEPPAITLELSYTVVEDTDAGLISDPATVFIEIRGVNDAPDAQDLVGSVDEGALFTGNLLAGATDVDGGPLTVTSLNGTPVGTTFNVTSTGGREGAVIAAATGLVNIAFDQIGNFEDLGEGETDTVLFTYEISDGNGGTDTASFTLTINGENDAPTFDGQSSFTIDENTTLVGDILGDDVEGDQIIYAIDGGADAALFEIDEDTGSLSFINAPDFEAPGDAGGDNQYDVTVSLSDGLAETTVDVIVNVEDVEEGTGPLVIMGTEGRDRLVGTEEDEVFYALGGSLDQMSGNGGSDTFVFGAELTNGRRERDVIRDFDATDDLLILADDNYTVRELSSGLVISHGGDRDLIYVLGDNLTVDNVQIGIGTFEDYLV